jgi:hypothetical protein
VARLRAYAWPLASLGPRSNARGLSTARSECLDPGSNQRPCCLGVTGTKLLAISLPSKPHAPDSPGAARPPPAGVQSPPGIRFALVLSSRCTPTPGRRTIAVSAAVGARRGRDGRGARAADAAAARAGGRAVAGGGRGARPLHLLAARVAPGGEHRAAPAAARALLAEMLERCVAEAPAVFWEPDAYDMTPDKARRRELRRLLDWGGCLGWLGCPIGLTGLGAGAPVVGAPNWGGPAQCSMQSGVVCWWDRPA